MGTGKTRHLADPRLPLPGQVRAGPAYLVGRLIERTPAYRKEWLALDATGRAEMAASLVELCVRQGFLVRQEGRDGRAELRMTADGSFAAWCLDQGVTPQEYRRARAAAREA